jgi:hypothetical protein
MALTTRAQADRWRQQHVIQVPTPPPAALPYYEQPTYKLLMALLRWVVGLLALFLLAAALWPGGQPTRPLRLAEEPATLIGRSSAEYRP